MKVKELIERLSQCDPDASVTIEYTDATDYVYLYDIDEMEQDDEAITDANVVDGDRFNLDPVLGKAVVIKLLEGEAFYGIG